MKKSKKGAYTYNADINPAQNKEEVMAEDIQKRLNSSESYISLALGVGVVLMIGTLVYNYATKGQVKSPTEEAAKTSVEQQTGLPTKHTVQPGETLWSISEKYYKTGYNWTDIQTANNLTNADDVTEGMELTIPVVTPIVEEKSVAEASPTTVPAEEKKDEPTGTSTPIATATVMATSTPTTAATAAPTAMEEKKADAPTPAVTEKGSEPTGRMYTVVAGDTLWAISQQIYKDPYKWSEVARANNLANPDLLYVGTVLQLP